MKTIHFLALILVSAAICLIAEVRAIQSLSRPVVPVIAPMFTDAKKLNRELTEMYNRKELPLQMEIGGGK
jgi:hypothetical protein